MNLTEEHREVNLAPVKWDYLLGLPASYNQRSDWPLLIFLHGRGERGDFSSIRDKCIPEQIRSGREDRFVVLAPMCPADTSWPLLSDSLDAVLCSVLATLNVDHNRVCLTGYSMGGYGAWVWASRCPDRFAAVAPICSGGGGYWLFDLDPQVEKWSANEFAPGSKHSKGPR